MILQTGYNLQFLPRGYINPETSQTQELEHKQEKSDSSLVCLSKDEIILD